MTDRILLVDDDPSLLRVTEKQLSDAGCEVVAVGDSAAALARFEEGGVDLLLTDIQMPGMDGLELLGEIKRRDAAAPVVVITAHGTVERAVSAMKTGAFDFLEKPLRGSGSSTRCGKLWSTDTSRRRTSACGASLPTGSPSSPSSVGPTR